MKIKLHTKKRAWIVDEKIDFLQAESKYLGKTFRFKEAEKVVKVSYFHEGVN